MLTFIRTNSENPYFQKLVTKLDAELKIRDGLDHAFYSQFNKIDTINEVIVAFEDDTAVGCGAFKSYSENCAEIKRMFVEESQRGKGIAGEILDQLEQWAQELNFTCCILETGINQPEAIRLYSKKGYLIITNYGQYANVENSVCFEKVL
jgi:GNAT superfamily N-acetyltransferase